MRFRGGDPSQPSKKELAGRIDRFLDTEAFIAEGGSRACLLCGTNGKDCLVNMRGEERTGPCCNGCANGNTHPAPGENEGLCAEWSASLGGGE